MLVTLIRPSTLTSQNNVGNDSGPPLGIAYLAGSLLKASHQVKVIDGMGEGIGKYRVLEGFPDLLQHGLTIEDILDRIPKETDLIGITSMFSRSWLFTRMLINKIHKRFPEVPLVAGGEHITGCAEYVLKDCSALTCCALGEGEETIVDLVDAIENNRSLEKVEGIGFIENGKVKFTPRRQRIRGIDSIPRPAWELIPVTAYLNNEIMFGFNYGRTMPIMASRGCPYLCTFCSSPDMWGTRWEARPPEDVLDEMLNYIAKYNVENFDFYDLTAIIRKDWVVKMSTLIKERGLKITWQLPSGTRSEAIDAEASRLLYESGCRFITYSPESGSNTMLEIMKKKIKKERVLDSMRQAVKNGLKVKANFVAGHPGETFGTFLETYIYIFKLAVVGVHEVNLFPLNPYPGSEVFNELLEKKRIKLDDDFFYKLGTFADFDKTYSYSDNFSGKTLGNMCVFGMVFFFAISFILRPIRPMQIFWNILKKHPISKLEMAVVRLSKKRKIKKSLLEPRME
jgi:anaerobic magnesium-protoporphyrin IX monomethyl ester cyclase